MAKVRKRTWTTSKGKENQAWIIDYTDNLGKRCQQSGFKTKSEAEVALAKILTDLDKGINVSANKNIRFKEAAQRHIDFYAKAYCKKSTQDGYKGYLENHLKPFFNNAKMIDISPALIREFISLKKDEELAFQTINHCLNLLGSIFERLIDDGILVHNPVRRVKKLKINRSQVSFFNYEKIELLLNTAKEYFPDFYPLLYTAIYTGMRRGELMALTWDDVDFCSKLITVDKSFHKNALNLPKTRESIRTIRMNYKDGDRLIEVLKEWKQKSLNNEKKLVFPNVNGGYMDADNMIKRRYNPVLKLAGIDRVKFHCTRHTYAAIKIFENRNPKYIQSQMGHSSIKVTLDTYGHLMPYD